MHTSMQVGQKNSESMCACLQQVNNLYRVYACIHRGANWHGHGEGECICMVHAHTIGENRGPTSMLVVDRSVQACMPAGDINYGT